MSYEDLDDGNLEYLEAQATAKAERRIKKPRMIVDGAGLRDNARLVAERDRKLLKKAAREEG
jgi:hypothetical protein